MADIRLEKRERTVWPWVLVGLVVLALLFWFLADRGPRVADVDVDAPPAAAVAPEDLPPGAAGDFATWVRNTDAREEAERANEYTAEGIRNLVDAIEDVANRGQLQAQQMDQELDRMRQYADSLSADAEPLTHARQARNAFHIGAELLENIDQASYPQIDTGVQQTRTAAGMVDANIALAQQIDRVEQFFEQSSATVSRMAHAHHERDEAARTTDRPAY